MADLVMGTASELSVLVPEIWSRNYYDTLLSSTPFRSLIDNSYQSEISQMGNTVNISQFPEFGEATTVNETARVDADSVTVSQIQLVINKRVAKDFILTNRSMLQSLPAMDKLQQLAIYSIQKGIQSLIIAAISPSTSSPDHVISYDSGTTLALADLLEGKELLDEAERRWNEASDEEREAFIGDLADSHIKYIQNYINAGPVLKHDIEFTCEKCGTVNKYTLNGLQDFFV